MGKIYITSIADKVKPKHIFPIIVVLFVLPFTLLIYFGDSYLGERVAFVRKEKMGHEYLRSLTLFLQHLQQDRGVSGAWLSEDALFKEKHEKIVALLEDDIKAVDAAERSYGPTLRTTERWNELKDGFKKLEALEASLTPKESFDAHTRVIGDILSLIFHVWNNSGLILDPSSDTHYLTSISTVRMPPVTEQLGKIRGIGVRVVVRGMVDPDERETLLVLSRSVEPDIDVVEKFTNYAYLGSMPRYEAAFHDAIVATNRFLKTVNARLIRADRIDIKAGEFYRIATEAIDANFQLMDTASTSLGSLLSKRLAQFEMERLYIRTVFFLLLTFFLYVMLRFRKSLARQAMAEDGLTESRRRLESITSTIGEGILVLDKEERITFVNPEGERLLGRPGSELLGGNILEFVRCGCHLKKLKTLKDCPVTSSLLANGKPCHTEEISFIRMDGTLFPAECILTKLTEGARKTGVVVAFQDISERKKTEEDLKTAIREKETLLKEVHHRVKNNLQIISSLFNLQAADTRGKDVSEIFRESQNRIRSMAIIHEKLYKASDISMVHFGEYIQDLMSYLFRSYRDISGVIRLLVDADDIYLDIDTATSLGLVINELVSNSIKYAFTGRQDGEITISLHPCGDDGFILTVADNGVGFHDIVNFKDSETLGLQIVNTLTKQIGGEIEMDVCKGTEFKIVFPGNRKH